MYGLTEIRTDEEKYVISTLISNITNEPDKKWATLTIYDNEKKEIAYWDNCDYLTKELLPLLEQVYNDEITMKVFYKKITEEDVKKYFPTKEDVSELYELFVWAQKLNMI